MSSARLARLRNEALVREAGADEVIVGDDLAPARAYGPYDLIIESLGGKTLAERTLSAGTRSNLRHAGLVGISRSKATIDVRNLIVTGGTTLYELHSYAAINRRTAC